MKTVKQELKVAAPRIRIFLDRAELESNDKFVEAHLYAVYREAEVLYQTVHELNKNNSKGHDHE